MRMSDCSSDVCSSDLAIAQFARFAAIVAVAAALLCYVLLPLAGDYGSFVVIMGLVMMPIAAWSVGNPLARLLLAFAPSTNNLQGEYQPLESGRREARRVGNECASTCRSRR